MKAHFFIVITSISLLSGCAYIEGRANRQTVSGSGKSVEVNQGPQTNAFAVSPSQQATENAAKMINPVPAP